MSELTGKSALVTGAGRGIGKATAEALAAAGAKVTLAAQSAHEIERLAEEIRGRGGEAEVVVTDVADYAAVTETIAHTRAYSVWELVDAVANRQVSKALARAHLLLGQGQAPLQLLALVIRQFRQLLVGADTRRRGGTVTEAAAEAGIPHFRERQFAAQLRQYSFEELLRALERLERADATLKSSKMPDTSWQRNRNRLMPPR